MSKKIIKKKVSKPSSKVSKSVTDIVKREISRATENKEIDIRSTGTNILPSNATGFSSTVIPVSPFAAYLTCVQGTTQATRIGNQFKIVKIKLQGTLFPKPFDSLYNPNPTPSRVIFWFFYDKQNPTSIPTPGTDFLQNGSSSTGLYNELIDCRAPINGDRYELKMRKVFKIGYSQYTGTNAGPNSQYFSNNDFKYNQDFSIDLTKHLVKHVRYNDNTSTPSTRGLFWMFTVIAANGVPFPTNYIPVEMEYNLTMTYEDM